MDISTLDSQGSLGNTARNLIKVMQQWNAGTLIGNDVKLAIRSLLGTGNDANKKLKRMADYNILNVEEANSIAFAGGI
jgi:hypothetical protein